MSEPFLGEVKMVGFSFAPRGWAMCDGRQLPIAQNTALFSLLGTIYGGDGRTVFNLPDLQGRVPIHQGQGTGLTNRPIGATSGQENVTISTAEMPAHSHTGTAEVNASSASGDSTTPSGKVWAASVEGDAIYGGLADATLADDAVELSLASAGRGQAHDNMPPFQVINFVIALVGVYPSRN